MLNNSFLFDSTMRELFDYPDPSFPLVVWTGNFQSFVERSIVCHWHNEFEYGVLLSGELDYFIDGQHIRLKQGDAVFINADTMHTASQVGDKSSVLMFTVSFLPSLFTGGKDGTMFRKCFQPVLHSVVKGFSIAHTTNDGSDIVKLLRELYDLSKKQSENYELSCLSAVSRLWNLTLCYMKEHQSEFISFRKNPSNGEKAKDILSYIQGHYAEDIQIAIECGFTNSSYFGKKFKMKYGVTPSKYRLADNSAVTQC